MSHQEIVFLENNINHLFDNCTHNFAEDDLTELKIRFDLVLKQCAFWVDSNNRSRHIYDLRDFGMWFCDKIAEVEREFWGEENS